jgi:MSHA biogenesis protein MshJ
MLQRQQGLRLVSMESLPPRPLLDDADAGGLGNVFRHGLKLEIEGAYLDILRYLRQLEGMEWQLFWGELDIQADTYPRNRAVLVVHTLSLREGWIGV